MVRESLEELEDGLHLVVARPAGAAGTRARLRLMVALIEALEPRGDYAVTVEGGRLHCRFERAGDAARLADTVQAESLQPQGLQSQGRVFVFDDRLRRTIRRALASPEGAARRSGRGAAHSSFRLL